MRVVSILHLRTKNSPNGNPRENGHHVRVTEEGLAGKPEWVRNFQNEQVWPMELDVTFDEYKRWHLLAAHQAGDWKLADA